MELGLGKLPWYGEIVTFLVVAVAGLVIFHVYWWVAPARGDISLAEQDLAQRRLEIDQALQAASQLREVEATVAELSGRLERLTSALPKRRDVSSLLGRLQSLAAQSSLSIRAFTAQVAERRELHAAWPIRLELNGTYHSLGVFFDRVSKFSKVIAISNVVIRAIDPRQLNATVSAECTATTFVLNDDVAEAPLASEPAI